MSYWMMIVVASGAVLALGVFFTLLIVALDHDADEALPSPQERRWTSVI